MRTATTWFDLYAQSHRNPVNKAIHWVCIPLILLASFGLLQAVGHAYAAAIWAVCLVFYFRLSWTIGVGMTATGAACLGVNYGIEATGASLAVVSAAIFAGAWVVQFVGHKIEGAKPSFFEDLQFLLVGPAWLLQFVYKRTGVPVETRTPAAS